MWGRCRAWARPSGASIRAKAGAGAAAAAVVEFDQAAEHVEAVEVLVTTKRGEHSGEVGCRGDGGAETGADRFAAGGAAEVVVAARACGLGNDVDAAVARLELDYRP